jgi:hypothetical protein
MFRQAGGITFISIATAFMARSNHPGLVQAHIFQVAAVIVVAIIALIFTVPDHKGSW